MSVFGIVAEWNPYHNGHHYLLDTIHKTDPHATIIGVMSGPFCQRGEPACFDKWLRTDMALADGLDLVLELPQRYATASLEGFAAGAIKTLLATGLCDHLAFGSESADIPQLRQAAQLLKKPSQIFQQNLKDLLAKGTPYQLAVQKAFQQEGFSINDRQHPNDRLALHYLKQLPDDFPVLAIARQGQHDAPTPYRENYASGTYLRQCLTNHKQEFAHYTPESTMNLSHSAFDKGWQIPDLAYFWPQLRHYIIGRGPTQLGHELKLKDGWENRLYSAFLHSHSLDEALASAQSKHYSLSSIRRALLMLLAPISSDSESEPTYLRVLGASSEGRKLLKQMAKTAPLPLLQNLGRDQKLLDTKGKEQLDEDCRRQNLSALLQTHSPFNLLGRDYQEPPRLKLIGTTFPMA